MKQQKWKRDIWIICNQKSSAELLAGSVGVTGVYVTGPQVVQFVISVYLYRALGSRTVP